MANLSNINGKFVVEQTTGYVGVGTTDPSYPIEVLNASAEIALNASGASIYRLRSDNTDSFRINKNGVGDRLVIAGNGNATFAGNVTVGNNTTNVDLYLKGGTDSNTSINFGDPSDNNVGQIIYRHAGNNMSFDTNDIERMRIDSSGNVGIGVTPSTIWSSSYNALQIGLGGSVYAHSSAGSSLNLGANIVYEGTAPNYYDKYLTSSTATKYEQDAGVHIWSTAVSGTAGNAVSWLERMRITNAGNVGIGTDSPNQKITIGFADNGTDGISFRSTTYASLGKILCENDNASTNGNLQFYTRSGGDILERMRIDSSGNVILNQATSRIYGGGTATGRFFLGNSDSKSYMMINGSAHTNPNLIYFVNDAAVTLTLNADNSATFAGNVTINKTSGIPVVSIESGDNYSVLTLKGGQTGDAANGFGIYSGYPSAGNFTIRENGVGNYLTIVKTTGNVGIGTDSPGAKLEINDGSTQTELRISVTGDTGYSTINFADASDINPGQIYYHHQQNLMNFRTNDNDRMVINSAGNVGIGTTDPDEKLVLYKPLGYSSDSALYSVYAVNSTAVDNNKVFKWRTGITGNQSGHNLTFSTLARTESSYAERMRIDSSGRVLIGTDNADIGGSVTGFRVDQSGFVLASIDETVATSTVAYLDRRGTNNEGAVLQFAMNGFYKATIDVTGTSANTNDGGMAFSTIATNGGFVKTERMRITSGGDIQIPTNSASLQLRGSGSGSYTSIRRDAANQLIVANTAGNQVFGIGNGGELAITNGASYGTTLTYTTGWNSSYQTLIPGNSLSPNAVYIVTIKCDSFGTPPYYASTVFHIATSPGTNGGGGGNDNIAPTATHVNSTVYWKYRLSTIVNGKNGVEAYLSGGPTPNGTTAIYVKATKIMTM